MESIKPISPLEALNTKGSLFHPGIIQIVNEFLAARYSGSGGVKILQKEIVDVFLQRHPDYDRKRVFNEHLLDFEPVYEKEGWKVVYDKPGFNEAHYEPSWRFESLKN